METLAVRVHQEVVATVVVMLLVTSLVASMTA